MTSSAKAEYLLSPEPAEVEGRFLNVTVQSPGGAYEFSCGKGEALLHAGLKNGVQLPYECATGTCGTCRGRLMTGDVDIGWEELPALAKLKRDKGDILLCQARAQSDCVVRVPSKVPQASRNYVPSTLKGRLKNCRLLTPDVIEFTIALSKPMVFHAGQFVLVAVSPVVGARAYSMVNYTNDTDEIVLVAKRKPGGAFCDWLFSGAANDTKVEIFGPLGHATFEPLENKNLLIVAGGSGIAGMMSILERATQTNYFSSRRGYVFFGVPTLADGFYLDNLSDYVTRAQDSLEVTLALSNEEPPSFWHPSYEGIRLAGGFVHKSMSASMADRYEDVLAYVAGPPPMVDAALRTLIAEGRLPPQSIRYDKFG